MRWDVGGGCSYIEDTESLVDTVRMGKKIAPEEERKVGERHV